MNSKILRKEANRMRKENEFMTTLRLNKNKPEHSKALDVLKKKNDSGFKSYIDIIVHALNSEHNRKLDELTISEKRLLTEMRKIIKEEISAITK